MVPPGLFNRNGTLLFSCLPYLNSAIVSTCDLPAPDSVALEFLFLDSVTFLFPPKSHVVTWPPLSSDFEIDRVPILSTKKLLVLRKEVTSLLTTSSSLLCVGVSIFFSTRFFCSRLCFFPEAEALRSYSHCSVVHTRFFLPQITDFRYSSLLHEEFPDPFFSNQHYRLV